MKMILISLFAYPIALVAHLCLVILCKLDSVYINVWKDRQVRTFTVDAVWRSRLTKGQLDISVVTDNSIQLRKNGTPIF